MAEDEDKYVPSGGNPKLDPTRQYGWSKEDTDKRNERSASVLKSISQQEDPFSGRLNSKLTPDGYEIGDGGVLRNKGYEYTKGYSAKEATKAERGDITERTRGKYGRGETLDMYGKRQRDSEPRKSDISRSMSPNYGFISFKSSVMKTAASPMAAGLHPVSQRFNQNVCGPMRVDLFASSGGAFQSNAQEAINLGHPLKLDDPWVHG